MYATATDGKNAKQCAFPELVRADPSVCFPSLPYVCAVVRVAQQLAMTLFSA
jgi:hypothetical protein